MRKILKENKINKWLVDKVKKKTDILKLVEDLGISVVKSSDDRWVTCCLFHEERTPSMTLYRGSNSFYCYGCTESGDAIALLQRVKGLSFAKAVEFLAKRSGIDIEFSKEETFDWEGSDEYSEGSSTETSYEDIFTFVAMETRKLIGQIKDVYSEDSVEFNEAVFSMESIYQKFDNTDVTGVKTLALSQLEDLANKLRETLNENRGHRGHSSGGVLSLRAHA